MNKQTTHCGFVALIGAPNAGKSTITNDFVGSKVSIVSPKVQTTRSLVRGIGIFENTQIIFIDTPGIFKPTHTAGSVALDVLKRYPHRAIFYPFQGFSAGRKADFSRLPLFLEVADRSDWAALEHFARGLSSQVYEADSARRKKIHLAGVIANNFVNQLYATATDLLAESGLGYEVLKPLIEETAAKALDASHPARVQTGPAKRGDRATQEGHLALLAENEALKQIYELLSEQIWETSKKI